MEVRAPGDQMACTVTVKTSLGVIIVGNTAANVGTQLKKNIRHMLGRVEAFQCGNLTYYIFKCLYFHCPVSRRATI